MLLLDDLQWVDRGSLSLLEYLASRLQGLRILVTLTFRDVEVDPEGPLRRSLLNLRLRGGLKEVSLSRFGSGETRALVEAVLGTPALSGDLTPPVVEKTGGNPLFVEEVLRALVEDGSLFRTPEGWQRRPESRVEIPPTVREVIHRRVDRIGPEAEGVLAVAAVLGNEFDFPTLQETSGMDPEKLLPLVEAALRARLLHEREVAPGQSTLRLADEQIRDVLYSSLSLVRRGQLHRRAGEGLERLLGNRSGERGEEVGQHYLLGNRPEKAAEFFTKAGDRAREVFAHEAAVAAYGRAVTLLDAALAGGQDSPGWRAIGLRTLQGLADVEYDSGQYERCTETYLRAASLAPPSDLPARALNLRWAAGALERRNDYTAALRLLDQAEEVLGEVPADPPPGAWRVAWLEVLYARTMVYYWLDDTERREQLLTRVRPVVERGQRPAELVRLYSYLGMHAWRRDRTITDAAFEVFRKGWACEEAARVAKVDPPVVGDDAFMRGWIYFWHGDFAEARAQLAEGIASAERRHNVEGLSRALTYAMLVARRMGDVEETRRFVPSVLAAADKANLPEYGAMAVANQAWLAWRDGEFDRVESPGEEALATWNRIPERYPVDWLALWPMMGVALSRGDVARAVDLGKRLLAPTQEPLPPHLRTLVEEAVAAQSVGDAAQASSALNRALEAAKGPGYV